jgi:hypothetical protein
MNFGRTTLWKFAEVYLPHNKLDIYSPLPRSQRKILVKALKNLAGVSCLSKELPVTARIKPVDEDHVSPDIREYFRLAEARGAPNATLLRILARDPSSLRIFYESWNSSFYSGRIDHLLKEIVRVRMAQLRGCHY